MTGAIEEPILLFDGTCNLCNSAIQFVLARERDHELRFVALQSSAARRILLATCGEEKSEALVGGADGSGNLESVVLIEESRAFTHSDAALRVVRHLRAPWRWLSVLAIVPRGLRDMVYRAIARRRYGIFGRTTECWVPTPELRARFLD
jgi:predicted DCC family thiol-disulfide oxidoreductase YuxK